MLDLWVSAAMSDNILITGEVLRQKWMEFADEACIPNDECLKLSDGWLAHYKTRTGLKEFKRHGEATSVGSETAKREKQQIQDLIRTYSCSKNCPNVWLFSKD